MTTGVSLTFIQFTYLLPRELCNSPQRIVLKHRNILEFKNQQMDHLVSQIDVQLYTSLRYRNGQCTCTIGMEWSRGFFSLAHRQEVECEPFHNLVYLWVSYLPTKACHYTRWWPQLPLINLNYHHPPKAFSTRTLPSSFPFHSELEFMLHVHRQCTHLQKCIINVQYYTV